MGLLCEKELVFMFFGLGISLLFIYIMPRMGSDEHEGWVFTKQTLFVVLIAILLFCLEFNWHAIAHIFSFMFRGGA